MKRIVRASYSPDTLDDLVYKYQDSQLSDEEIWDEIVNEYGDQSLADDVLEALTYPEDEVYGSAGLMKADRQCQQECRNAFSKFNGSIPVWKLQDIYHEYPDVNRQLINMWCRGN